MDLTEAKDGGVMKEVTTEGAGELHCLLLAKGGESAAAADACSGSGAPATILDAANDADGTWLACGADNGVIYVWALRGLPSGSDRSSAGCG